MIAAAEREAAALESAVRDLSGKIARADEQIAALTTQIKPVQAFVTTDVYAALAQELAALEARLTDAGKYVSEKEAVCAAQIKALTAEINARSEKRAEIWLAESQRRRVEELKAQEKELAAAYEDAERGIYLCDLFIRAKVSLVTEQINRRFRTVKFRLFVEQINGGLKEDCEVMIPTDAGNLAPYSTANNGARINAGLEIIDMLGRHWGVTMPVIIDNAESVTRLTPISAQVIRLVVSAADPVLRTEVSDRSSQRPAQAGAA
jgi:hypothetical protein